MARKKIKQTQEKLDKIKLEAEELTSQLKDAEDKEQELLNETTEKINVICKEAEYFCGVILSRQDLLAVLDLAMQTQIDIKIPYRLYPIDESEKT
ncbi:MAG: hypothetical protein RBT65_05900 [Methanolobus sp.]|jgi:lipid II:glycine glycyltransferase (peptidoglycan interpeptide bridge formation enzyme)|nr:hypothetical protein [Methanolobus sp.]